MATHPDYYVGTRRSEYELKSVLEEKRNRNRKRSIEQKVSAVSASHAFLVVGVVFVVPSTPLRSFLHAMLCA